MKKLILLFLTLTFLSTPSFSIERINTRNFTCSELNQKLNKAGMLHIRYWLLFKRSVLNERPECPYYASPVTQRVPSKNGFCLLGWRCEGRDDILSFSTDF